MSAANLVSMHAVMERYAGRAGRQRCWRLADCLRLAREEAGRWPLPLPGIDVLERALDQYGEPRARS